mmetsp:Transcript_2854/g.7670  ORF Transcript_2854/g.7670 Transcript_2854/m.7670 type:complete len:208 (+) Transcript_2854:997-1620(+)
MCGCECGTSYAGKPCAVCARGPGPGNPMPLLPLLPALVCSSSTCADGCGWGRKCGAEGNAGCGQCGEAGAGHSDAAARRCCRSSCSLCPPEQENVGREQEKCGGCGHMWAEQRCVCVRLQVGWLRVASATPKAPHHKCHTFPTGTINRLQTALHDRRHTTHNVTRPTSRPAQHAPRLRPTPRPTPRSTLRFTLKAPARTVLHPLPHT